MQPGSNHVARIEVQSAQLVIELTNAKSIGSKRSRSRNMLKVSWRKTPLRRRREILAPGSVPRQDARAIRSENRALLVTSIARGRRWLDELITDPTAKAESIATRALPRRGNFAASYRRIGDSARPVDLAGCVSAGRQSRIGSDASRPLEASGVVDRRKEAKSRYGADARCCHEPSDLTIVAG